MKRINGTDDFRSPLRKLAGIQDQYNRKGLVSNKE